MINFVIYNICNFILSYYWVLFPKKINNNNLQDINFINIDFTNYKRVRSYVFKDNFVYQKKNISIGTFEFLNYLKKTGGGNGIDLSKKNIFKWYKVNKFKKNYLWKNEYITKRVLNILYNYEFITSASSKEEKLLINKIVYIHLKRFLFEINNKKINQITCLELKTLILSSFILNKKLHKYIYEVEKILLKQIDENGMHKSYNILEHAKCINNIQEIKKILLYYKLSLPESINYIIINMTSTLNNYIHEDKSIALFNGANNNYNKKIFELINQAEFIKSKTYINNVNGIAFYFDKEKKFFFEVVQPSSKEFSNSLSAGTLSVEFSADGEKIITNCGASESTGANPEYLRFTAAHSTIILNNTNVSEIKQKLPHAKFPGNVSFNKIDESQNILFEGAHNGYQKRMKKIIKRKININKKNINILGEDTIISLNSNKSDTVFHIRFHLMPGIITNITNNKKSVILKTKKGNVFLFESNSEISLENSIYVDNNLTKQTQQIVIKGIVSKQKETRKWSIVKYAK